MATVVGGVEQIVNCIKRYFLIRPCRCRASTKYSICYKFDEYMHYQLLSFMIQHEYTNHLMYLTTQLDILTSGHLVAL